MPLAKITFFSKKKIWRKKFKKNIGLILITKLSNINLILNKKINIYRKYIGEKSQLTKAHSYDSNSSIINISQRSFNPKATITVKNNFNVNTFSVGSIIKYFKIKQSKYIRRSLKGTKIFLNFLKNVFLKKYSPKPNTYKSGHVLFIINGFDYNLFFYKKNLKNFLSDSKLLKFYFLLNLKISFTKTKDKKVKSIKKRLKKKIMANFLKNVR